jgi:hypothetical protein
MQDKLVRFFLVNKKKENNKIGPCFSLFSMDRVSTQLKLGPNFF